MTDNSIAGETVRGRFTGWHMTAILVTFFAVVMTVNFIMARYALSTFGGKVVENSYVASQQYNEWLARAAAQERLGWDKLIQLDDARHVRLKISKNGRTIREAKVTATLTHPLGRTDPRDFRFAAQPDGALRSLDAVPRGRWRLDLLVRRGADEARYREEVQ